MTNPLLNCAGADAKLERKEESALRIAAPMGKRVGDV